MGTGEIRSWLDDDSKLRQALFGNAEQFIGVRCPHPHGTIITACGHDAHPIWAECRRGDVVTAPCERRQFYAGLRIPYPRGTIKAHCYDARPIRSVTSFDITDMHGATIESAVLDMSDYQLSGSGAFEWLHPLHIEQVEYTGFCDLNVFYFSPITTLAQFSDYPGLNTPIDVTDALSAHLESGDPDYFQIRVRWEHDDAGAAFANTISWNAVAMTVVYVMSTH